ncbi:hypothetical protein FA15DRAFT_269833 [Coprinopsis marcescibilis]|uniref:Uncharacterized protein n=1 Tax=Coprinopsis marcescibilis TaxID=230819 RepID=A0A5C3KE25_COPMA|nr:hypothetical protein FA15DRAFT_269833 [Coprinopsis marcescibilis]
MSLSSQIARLSSAITCRSRFTTTQPPHLQTLVRVYTTKENIKKGGAYSPASDLSQGHIESEDHKQSGNVQAQYSQSGHEAKDRSESTLDAASKRAKVKPSSSGKGNPEGIGMVDQVGSQSGQAEHFDEAEATRQRGKEKSK